MENERTFGQAKVKIEDILILEEFFKYQEAYKQAVETEHNEAPENIKYNCSENGNRYIVQTNIPVVFPEHWICEHLQISVQNVFQSPSVFGFLHIADRYLPFIFDSASSFCSNC